MLTSDISQINVIYQRYDLKTEVSTVQTSGSGADWSVLAPKRGHKSVEVSYYRGSLAVRPTDKDLVILRGNYSILQLF